MTRRYVWDAIISPAHRRSAVAVATFDTKAEAQTNGHILLHKWNATRPFTSPYFLDVKRRLLKGG